MKVVNALFVVATPLFLLLTLETSIAQDVSTSQPPPLEGPSPGNVTCCGGHLKRKGDPHHHRRQSWNNRASRSAAVPPNPLEEKLKEFAEKLGKTPDDLRAAFGKFMLAQGISVQQMQESLHQGHQAALQVVESIKKAMRT